MVVISTTDREKREDKGLKATKAKYLPQKGDRQTPTGGGLTYNDEPRRKDF